MSGPKAKQVAPKRGERAIRDPRRRLAQGAGAGVRDVAFRRRASRQTHGGVVPPSSTTLFPHRQSRRATSQFVISVGVGLAGLKRSGSRLLG